LTLAQARKKREEENVRRRNGGAKIPRNRSQAITGKLFAVARDGEPRTQCHLMGSEEPSAQPPDSDQIPQHSEMSRWAQQRKSPQRVGNNELSRHVREGRLSTSRICVLQEG